MEHPVPRVSFLAAFADYVHAQRDAIGREWMPLVRESPDVSKALHISHEALQDHVPALMEDLVERLRLEKEGPKQVAADHSRTHGYEQWKAGYNISELIWEIYIIRRVLTQSVLAEFTRVHPEYRAEEGAEAETLIHDFFHRLTCDSVGQFVEEQQRVIQEKNEALQQTNEARERLTRTMRDQDLVLSEQRRLALDSAQMGWWQLDLDSRQVVGDERFKAIFGTGQEVVSYDWLLSVIHWDDRAGIDAAVQAAVRPVDPVPYAVECRLVSENGSIRWATAKGQAIFAGEGLNRRAVSLMGTLTDVTREKEAARALAASEVKYRSIFNSIDQGYCVIEMIFNADGQPVDYLFLEVNPAFEKQTGLRDTIGRRMRELAPGHEEDWFKIYGQVAATGLPTRFEAEAAALGRWYDVYANRMEDSSEHHVAVAFMDITARRASEEALQAERELLRTVFDQAPDDAILIMDAERTLTAWNPAAERITGWTAAEAVGQSADLIFMRADRAAGRPQQETEVAAREGKAADERWRLRKDGSRFWGSGTMNALHDPEGQVRGYLKVFRDATARHEETETLAFFRQLTDALLDHPDPEQIIEIVERSLGEHLGASRVLVTEASEDGHSVTVNQVWTLPGLKDLTGTYRLADFGTKIADDYAAGRTHVRRDAEQEYPPGPELDNILTVQATAAIDVPVRIDGHLRFVLVVHQVTPRDWTDREVTLVRQVADRMAAEVQRARSERALRSKESASRFLADLGETTRQATNPDAVLGMVVDALRTHLSAGRCAYVEVEEDEDAITIRYDRVDPVGKTPSLAGRYRLADFGQRMSALLRAGQTVMVANFATDPLFTEAKDAMASVSVAALVNVPLVKAGKLVAILAVNEPRPRRWTTDEVALIEAVAERSWGEVERSRDARALTESEARFRQLADAMPQIVWTARPDGHIDYYNERWYEYTGAARGRFGDESWAGIIDPDDLGCVIREWGHATAMGQHYEQEFRVRREADGEYRWFLGRGVPVKDAYGQVLRWIGTNTDLHAIKILREQNEQLLVSERLARSEAERISRVKDEFLATLSHELRTPLNAILGWTQVLRGDLSNLEDIQDGLATIERNARAQTQIIEDLLDMSKIISGKVRLDVQQLQLDQIVSAAVDTMRPAATVKGIRLSALIDPQARMISGDPNRLQQVFWNLLSNAIKFTPKEGRVHVVLERIHSHVEVSITDSGEGIAPEFLPYVFDRFRQQDASTTRRHGGLGLGLAIVKQLVELHGGQVRVESAGPGQGTTFKVLLPLSVVQPAPDPADPERRHPQAGTTPLPIPADRLNLAGVKVLVVDDEADARALVQRLLEDRGALVQTAGSAAEAIEMLASQRPDVLVSDIGMPEEDGYTLIRRVRALPAEQGGNTPAVALTAYARSEDRLKAIMAGFQNHLAKPVEAAELLALVATLVGRVAG